MFYGEYKVQKGLQKGLYLLLCSGCSIFIMNIFFILDTLQIVQKETSSVCSFIFVER